MPTKTTLVMFLAIGFAVWAIALDKVRRNDSPGLTAESVAPVPQATDADAKRREMRRIALPHLKWAEEECKKLVAQRMNRLDADFQAMAKHGRPFAADILGWRSKFLLIGDSIPFFGSEGAHRQFIKESFERHFFSAEDLERMIRQAIRDVIESCHGVESEMLVRIRLDLGDLADEFGAEVPSATQFHGAIEKSIAESAGRAAQAEARDEAIRFVASTIAGEILSAVTVRLAVSSGILATGAASGTATLGIGLAASIVVDVVISVTWDWIADPHGQLADRVEGQLGEMRILLIDGDMETPGLRSRLDEMIGGRAVIREQIILGQATVSQSAVAR